MVENNDARRTVELAAITGAHGISGEVRLKLFGEGVEALSAHKSFIARDTGAVLTLKKVRPDNKGGAVARFAECSTRNDAEKMRGTVITVSQDALPALEEGEYYHADLIGLTAVTDTGKPLGEVIAVENFGATDIVEVRKDPPPAKGTKTFMVPMTKDAVLEWDAETLVIAADFADD
ncbi:ribosome maturation factor RimM [Erythrobacter sp. F6033]|uniref:ribosome maturation factor RimM n=1 Tax=Erythrobacter sp. F6033 TaxID=2926401 RepID=UPI001FF6827E|nr:ribosome maturation factor RimM [Erythrobacter sp. F6033]MCK0128128.1 ribosome maturation factor RimM [Erythrobacter sp. F6033]